ncbi:MAG: hypothetical protein Q9228_008060 [Teloschistes exilis]
MASSFSKGEHRGAAGVGGDQMMDDSKDSSMTSTSFDDKAETQIDELYAKGGDRVRDTLDEMPATLSDVAATGERLFLRGRQRIDHGVRKQPAEALLLAGAIGYLVGWAASQDTMNRKVCNSAQLQGICLDNLKACPGFEHVSEILIQPRETLEGGTNWTLAAVRPRVPNTVLRAARSTIEMLQTTYELPASEAVRPVRRLASAR